MNKCVSIYLLSIVLTISATSSSHKRDLIDEAQASLDTLRLVVQAAIAQGDLSVENLSRDKLNTLNQKYSETMQTIVQQSEDTDAKLATIKTLAANAGVNIDICLQQNEENLDELPQNCRNELSICYQPFVIDMDEIMKNSKYKIDILINEVDAFGFLLQKCNMEILCVSSLKATIEDATITIPEKIDSEINEVAKLLQEVSQPIGTCMDNALAHMTLKQVSILDDITKCVDNI